MKTPSATGPRLTRRDPDGSATTWQASAPIVQPEPEDEAPRPTSRRVSFELPDGFMATISLVPYTEVPAEPEPPPETTRTYSTGIHVIDPPDEART